MLARTTSPSRVWTLRLRPLKPYFALRHHQRLKIEIGTSSTNSWPAWPRLLKSRTPASRNWTGIAYSIVRRPGSCVNKISKRLGNNVTLMSPLLVFSAPEILRKPTASVHSNGKKRSFTIPNFVQMLKTRFFNHTNKSGTTRPA